MRPLKSFEMVKYKHHTIFIRRWDLILINKITNQFDFVFLADLKMEIKENEKLNK